MPFCHYGHANEFIKDNVGMLDEVLDGKRKQKNKFSSNMIRQCWMKGWILFLGLSSDIFKSLF